MAIAASIAAYIVVALFVFFIWAVVMVRKGSRAEARCMMPQAFLTSLLWPISVPFIAVICGLIYFLDGLMDWTTDMAENASDAIDTWLSDKRNRKA